MQCALMTPFSKLMPSTTTRQLDIMNEHLPGRAQDESCTECEMGLKNSMVHTTASPQGTRAFRLDGRNTVHNCHVSSHHMHPKRITCFTLNLKWGPSTSTEPPAMMQTHTWASRKFLRRVYMSPGCIPLNPWPPGMRCACLRLGALQAAAEGINKHPALIWWVSGWTLL